MNEQEIRDIASQMCDEYCKYPNDDTIPSQEYMDEVICHNCPLNRLVEHGISNDNV